MSSQKIIDVLTSNIDTLWVIDCAILVFIMQAGFMCMETGLSRHKNSINVALKNAADFGVSVVIFWFLDLVLCLVLPIMVSLGLIYFSSKQIKLST